MGTIFQKIDEEKIETIEQIVKISDLRQMIDRNIDCCNSECSWYCFKQDLEIEVKNGYTSFNNCVFLDDVKVQLREDKPRIEFSNCIFKGKVSFQVISNSSEFVCVDIRSCSINQLVVQSRLSNLGIAYSTINNLIMMVKSSYVFFESNIIYQFAPHEGVSESGELILFDNEFKCLFDYDCKSEEYLLKEPGNQIEHNLKFGKDVVKRNFYDALLNNSDVKFERNKHARYLFWKRFYSASNLFGKICILLTGAFCFPILFLFYALFIICLFGMVYYMVDVLNGDSITLLHAMYYSGITFTTLGYTEIAADTHQMIKLLSVIEAFIGVLVSSCIITSFINKYSD